MDIYQYIIKTYPEVSDQIIYLLNNEDCMIFGGFIRNILINEKWNKEVDILCYNFDELYNNFIKKFPPDSIENLEIHYVLKYGNYRIDLCKIFYINDFTFNCLGLIGENIVIVPNVFSYDINTLLYGFDKKEAIGFKNCPNYKIRKSKFKNWKILNDF
jgi:hypothetical protein